MFLKGSLRSQLITDSENEFSLEGFINPTFTNVGDSPVMVDGETLAKGESFKVDLPGVILTGTISINFTSPVKTERQLSVRYGILSQ